VRFSSDGFLKILFGATDSIEGPQVTVGVDGFSLGGRPKEPGYLRETFLVRLGRKSEIFTIRLRFSCKSFLQKSFCLRHDSLPPFYWYIGSKIDFVHRNGSDGRIKG
jgi:hypothetical protein